MTKPKGTNFLRFVPFVLPIFKITKEVNTIPRKKKPETLEELYAEQEKAQEELRKAKKKSSAIRSAS